MTVESGSAAATPYMTYFPTQCGHWPCSGRKKGRRIAPPALLFRLRRDLAAAAHEAQHEQEHVDEV
ncbi:MAG: hypothetical protein QFB89_04770, partial [Pseudomonadota bacterium]|nr:hypothetical protein [Pseudomonadota bacterium]